MSARLSAQVEQKRKEEAEAQAKGMTPDAVRQGYASGTAMKRLTDPEDVAAMALFLASDGAKMVSGQALAVDGMTYNVDP
jgi:NAD(P)-dependent dehydrogenase (short-subunit alcohol dehydrogenase family)